MKIKFKAGAHEFPRSVAMGFIRGGLADEVVDEPEPKKPEKKEDKPAPPIDEPGEADAAPPQHEAPPEAGETKDEKPPETKVDRKRKDRTKR